jgi:hypothetical protein
MTGKQYTDVKNALVSVEEFRLLEMQLVPQVGLRGTYAQLKFGLRG